MDRRNFFKASAAVSAGALLIPEIVRASVPGNASSAGIKKHALSKGNTVLFQGDSITDWGRNRDEEAKANTQSQLGGGYVLFAAASLLAGHADKDLKIYNRGISGNKVFQLAERWDKDCIDIRPDILSILIGVNDFWHTKSGGYTGTLETYENDYRKLLERTKKNLPEVKIVVCEPFIISGGTALDDTRESDFAGYRKAAQRLAREFQLTFVPYQAVFNEALKKASADYWGPDGVHPSLAGSQLMAQTWMKCIQ